MIPTAARRRIAATGALLIAANVLTWAWAGFVLHGQPGMLGIALLAWTFGLRHAIDADHIAAIDNVVRKLVHNRRRAWDSGLFFALGHSATVLLLCFAIAAAPGVPAIEGLRAAVSDWGTLVSALFLLLIGLVNLRTLLRLRRAGNPSAPHFSPHTFPAGAVPSSAHPPDALMAGGAMIRILRPVQRLVGRSWHMLPVGFLFGLGFDTASEVALLVLTAQQAAAGLSPAAVAIFPALFAAGMTLVDTADSTVMTGAYAWALQEPTRRRGYNMAVTALSVVVAAGVGGIELLGVVAQHTPDVAGAVPLVTNLLVSIGGPFTGFAIVSAFLLFWGAAVLASWWRARVVG